MVIIQLAGGLGNQMFQYALYLQLKGLGREVKIDDVSGFIQDVLRKPALAPFGISYERPTKRELEVMLDASALPWQRVRRKLFGRHKKSYFEESKRFLPEVLTLDDIYLEGYWQSQRYFQDVEKQVRASFDTDRLLAYLQKEGGWNKADDRRRGNGSYGGKSPRPCAGIDEDGGNEKGTEKKSVEQYLEEINNACSVSVHIRRGDYLTPENQTLFGGICTEAYYIEGTRLMRERYPDCRFYLFCNDREWAREKTAGRRDITFVDLSYGGVGSANGDRNTDYAEFVLMSRCKHHILANSSFSWWASYLNPNADKFILAPERWLNNTDCSDFYREDMHRIVLQCDQTGDGAAAE